MPIKISGSPLTLPIFPTLELALRMSIIVPSDVVRFKNAHASPLTVATSSPVALSSAPTVAIPVAVLLTNTLPLLSIRIRSLGPEPGPVPDGFV